jgi:Mg-chelatase subunit ChlD
VRYIYVSAKGGKPLNIGMNKAKRIAHRSDKQDRVTILLAFGAGMPNQPMHHQELVRARHRYYHEQHEEFVRGQQRAA